MVPINTFSLVGVGTQKRSLPSESTVQLKLAVIHFESETWDVSIVTEATKEEMSSELSENGILKTHLWQLLSSSCNLRKRTAQYQLFHLLMYRRIVPRLLVSRDIGQTRKEDISEAEKKLLKLLEILKSPRRPGEEHGWKSFF